MRVRLLSVTQISGIAKATNQPFGPIYRLSFLAPLEQVNTDKFQKSGFGFDLIEQAIDEGFYKKWHQENPAIPAGGLEVDLVVEQRPGRRGFESVVTGYKVAKALAAA